MVYSYFKIERYERTGDNVWSSTPVEITDVYDPLINLSLGDGKDTFEFKLQNFNGEWDNVWNMGDKLSLYYKVNNSSVVSSDLLIQGIVTDTPFTIDGKKNFIRIKGNNYSETLMNALVFYTPPAAGVTVPEFLEAAINSIALFNDNFKVTWNTGNPSVKSDLSAFPKIYDKWFYKSALKLIEQYSADSETGDGNYYWYINVDNELIWRRKTESVDFEFNTNSDEYKALTVKKDTSGIVNFVIAKGGLDPKGNAISIKRDDAISRAKHGFKYKLITLSATDNNNLTQQDQIALGNENVINESNYPSTTGWVATTNKDSSPTMVAGNNVSCSSWSEYIEAYRTEIKYRLNNQARDYMSAHKYGKLQVQLNFASGKGWSIGNNVKVTVPEIGAINKAMRIKEFNISNNSEIYVLEEDEGSI